jgi:hypothetical protein
MPRFLSSSSSLSAVVVLPDPEGPESKTSGLTSSLLMIWSAAPIFSAHNLIAFRQETGVSCLILELIS